MELKLGWLKGGLDPDLDLRGLESFEAGSGTCLPEYTSPAPPPGPETLADSKVPMGERPRHRRIPTPKLGETPSLGPP